MKKNPDKKIDRRGRIFYETAVLTENAPISRIKKPISTEAIFSMTNMMEMVVLWTALAIDIILLARMFLTYFGIAGDNLLSFLFYALSYPLISIFPFAHDHITQIPLSNIKFEGETLIIFFFYLVFAMAVTRIIHVFQHSDFLNKE